MQRIGEAFNPHRFWETKLAKELGVKPIFVLKAFASELKLSWLANMMYAVLRSYAGRKGIFPSQETLARIFLGERHTTIRRMMAAHRAKDKGKRPRETDEIAKRTVRYALDELKKKKLLRTELRKDERGRGRTSDSYYFLWHPGLEGLYKAKYGHASEHKIGEPFKPEVLRDAKFASWTIPFGLLREVSAGAAMVAGILSDKLGPDGLDVSTSRAELATVAGLKSKDQIRLYYKELETLGILRRTPQSAPDKAKIPSTYAFLRHWIFGCEKRPVATSAAAGSLESAASIFTRL